MNDTCYHCGLEVTPNNKIQASIKKTQQKFCCVGCASVCQTIYNSGLETFYQQQTNAVLPVIKLEYPLEFYDASAFQTPFLQISDTGTKTLTLISDTIHCAACVWLIERAIGTLDGVLWVRANLTNKQIKLCWTEADIKLSVIMQRLADLGYSAMPYEQNLAEMQAAKKNKEMLYRISFSAFTMMNLLWISIALYTGAAQGQYDNYFQWLGFVLATPTVFYAGLPFLKNAYIGIKNGLMNMDVPISIGALSTYGYSVFVLLGFSSKGEVYFDTVVNFIFVILLGRYWEAASKKTALSASSSLQQLRPKVTCLKTNNGPQVTPVDVIKAGAVIWVKSGERIALDGNVVEGVSTVDESLLSGESLPLYKKQGDPVYAGTLNINGTLEIKVSKTSRQSVLSQIVELVENTSISKSKIVCSIDKIIPYFVWTTLFLALATFVYWFKQDTDLALLSAVSVLIITCPCAFGLATPMSIAVASGTAAKHKILIKNGDAIELLDRVKHVVFDKTGTLTLGKFSVEQVVSNIDEKQLMRLMSSIEKQSEHPLAKAIVKHSKANLPITDFTTTPGQGVSAKIDGTTYKIGNLAYVGKAEATLIYQAKQLEDQGCSCVWCADESAVLGFVALADQVKIDAKITIKKLKQMGKTVHMLSGDSNRVAQALAQTLDIEHVIAQVLPDDKARHIQWLQKTGTVLMVGDGVNDAPALVQADTSIAIGSGSDVSVSYAHVVILKPTLSAVIDSIYLSQQTRKIIKQNIIFALLYNALMVPLAMMALVTPLFAAIAMPISSLLVIGNAIRLTLIYKQKSQI